MSKELEKDSQILEENDLDESNNDNKTEDLEDMSSHDIEEQVVDALHPLVILHPLFMQRFCDAAIPLINRSRWPITHRRTRPRRRTHRRIPLPPACSAIAHSHRSFSRTHGARCCNRSTSFHPICPQTDRSFPTADTSPSHGPSRHRRFHLAQLGQSCCSSVHRPFAVALCLVDD